MINQVQKKLICDYIEKINSELEYYNATGDGSNIFDLLSEIISVFAKDIPHIQDSVLFGNTTVYRDISTVKGLLKKYLADYGVEYVEKESDENRALKRFWLSFITWFEKEFVFTGMVDKKYCYYDSWDGGRWYLNLDYEHEFKMRRGVPYPDSLKNGNAGIEDIKAFLELAYKYWVVNEGKSHYDFTIEVNDRFRMVKLPYKLQSGVVIRQGYKTTFIIDKVLDYRMFERKIKFSEDMINSSDFMEKKSALDFLIDSLQYLISIQAGNREKQYAALACTVKDDANSKCYAVIKQELNELMKISNEYFDIRHNDYLNGAKEKRESLNDSQFIEYLYNRAYALLYLLRLKHN